ncbi:putative membrane protein [Keratinibaculum paraultunense]|uniref:Putative membrane protein n=1 Tax=Keratinibaculum paraultunense TaxID=1278232 RepID=A0A4R3KTF2_9FIRM|nr:small multi-drug export protein [Keratinibaculum paraultunense]QQY79162.1 small multi-drug export protein [Keratinibaculum paraultunense]TCS88546.1 putative membrane protein [Keratinibaculum paraultunense]
MWELLEEIKTELIVLIVAAMPLSELRGAIPLGISLGLSPIHSTVISILGNMMIVPILLKILNPVMNYLENTTLFSKFISWVKSRTMNKTRKTIKKYSLVGLFILVAIPIPTTGAWTGCIAASLLRLDFKKALISILSGVFTAGIIVSTISYGILG